MSIEFILDGRNVTAEPGQTILEVARANGIKIPTLCREQRISKTTSCFVCVVRDKKTGRFMPSCAAMPAPGQAEDIIAAGGIVIANILKLRESDRQNIYFVLTVLPVKVIYILTQNILRKIFMRIMVLP